MVEDASLDTKRRLVPLGIEGLNVKVAVQPEGVLNIFFGWQAAIIDGSGRQSSGGSGSPVALAVFGDPTAINAEAHVALNNLACEGNRDLTWSWNSPSASQSGGMPAIPEEALDAGANIPWRKPAGCLKRVSVNFNI